jgi:hypothetical protein
MRGLTLKDVNLFIITALGWLWGIVQFIQYFSRYLIYNVFFIKNLNINNRRKGGLSYA